MWTAEERGNEESVEEGKRVKEEREHGSGRGIGGSEEHWLERREEEGASEDGEDGPESGDGRRTERCPNREETR